jgi:hypothetical protein
MRNATTWGNFLPPRPRAVHSLLRKCWEINLLQLLRAVDDL